MHASIRGMVGSNSEPASATLDCSRTLPEVAIANA